MANFFSELKRRHIYQVAAAYVVVAWVLLQLFNNLTPIMTLPDWAGTLVLVLLIGGFPIALLFAWIHQLAPAPLLGAPVRPAAGKPEQVRSRVWGFLPRQFASANRGHASRTAVAEPICVSIAVLPFANMSGDLNQEFFSDGMTEELTAALVKVSELRVVARTSAFEFKGQNHNVRAMGEALGASYLIEGSVRKAGERVRITAQLIKTDDGTHLWSEKYDRDLVDVFAVQEEIAQAIAGALRLPLGLKEGEVLVTNRTGDVESYQTYLRARALVRARGPGIAEGVALLEPLVAHNPSFAPAWALLAHAYYLIPSYDPLARTGTLAESRNLVSTSFDKAEIAARRAIKLDGKNAAGHVSLAAIYTQRGRWASAEDLLQQALMLDPSDPDALYNLSVMLTSVGRFKHALSIIEKLLTLEPFVPNYNITAAGQVLMDGDTDKAIRMLQPIAPTAAGGYYRAITLAQAYAAQGRFADAADTLRAMPNPNMVSRKSVEDAIRLLGTAPVRAALPQELPALEGGLNFVYAYIGAEERTLEFLERLYEATGGGTTIFIWAPTYAAVRKTERFKAHARAVGLVDYWRARGWPERCHPITGDDFVCE